MRGGLSILWGILGFVMIYIGLNQRIRVLRIAALLLWAITIIKLFTYDFQQTSDAVKIVAFIALGILLLVVSFLYQRLKSLLAEDENK